MSWVNFVSPLGLGCACWWWLSILGSPDTAALGWCGPRWNPAATSISSNSSASISRTSSGAVPLAARIMSLRHRADRPRRCPVPPLDVLRTLVLLRARRGGTYVRSVFLHRYPLNGITFSRARQMRLVGRTYTRTQRSANSIRLFHGRRERSVVRDHHSSPVAATPNPIIDRGSLPAHPVHTYLPGNHRLE